MVIVLEVQLVTYFINFRKSHDQERNGLVCLNLKIIHTYTLKSNVAFNIIIRLKQYCN